MRPVAFYRIGVPVSDSPLHLGMVYKEVLEIFGVQQFINPVFVCVYNAALADVLIDYWHQGFTLSVVNRKHPYFTVPLNHSEQAGLIGCSPTSLTFGFTTNQGF